jgi:hypothetical protein
VNRWETAPPYEWSGAWEGRLQIAHGHDTKTDVCGHLHESSAEAERCAQDLAARLNSKLTPFDPRIPDYMPSDYYLGLALSSSYG